MVGVDIASWQKGEGAPIDVKITIEENIEWSQNGSNYKLLIGNKVTITSDPNADDFKYLLWGKNWYEIDQSGVIDVDSKDALQLLAKFYFSQEEQYLPNLKTEAEYNCRFANAFSSKAKRRWMERNTYGNFVPVSERKTYFLNEVLRPQLLSVTAR